MIQELQKLETPDSIEVEWSRIRITIFKAATEVLWQKLLSNLKSGMDTESKKNTIYIIFIYKDQQMKTGNFISNKMFKYG